MIRITPKIAVKMIREKRGNCFKRVEYPKDIKRRYIIIVFFTIIFSGGVCLTICLYNWVIKP